MYTVYMDNRALYVYINACTYMHLHWKPLHPLCSWSGYGPEDKILILMLIYLYSMTPQER